ncbi:MAG: ATP-binding protein [Verrucomicrobiota bacterium]
MKACRVLWVMLVLNGLLAYGVTAASPLLRIEEVRSLPPEEARKGFPVRINAQILHVFANQQRLHIHDGNYGSHVMKLPGGKKFTEFRPGDLVRVIGKTGQGQYFPIIQPTRLVKTGEAPLPVASKFTRDQFYDVTLDAEWVSLRGLLVAVWTDAGSRSIIMRVDWDGTWIHAQTPFSEAALQRIRQFLFRRIWINAVVGSLFNQQRQLTGRSFFVPNVENIQQERNFVEGENVISRPIHELMRADIGQEQMVETWGEVIHQRNNIFYIRGEEAALRVMTNKQVDLQRGDSVVIQGLSWPQPVSPAFRAVQVNVVSPSDEPEPLVVKLKKTIDSRLNYELIQLDAVLVDAGKTFGFSPQFNVGDERLTFLLRSGPNLLRAYLPASELDNAIVPGAKLRVTGICHLIASPQAQGKVSIRGLTLNLRDASDIQVLVPVPWWTPKKMLAILSLLIVVLLLSLTWMASLRRRVREQTSVIGRQIERQTVMDERQRIARELHDNLEQGLAGMAIQLRGALKLLQRQVERRCHAMEQTLDLAGDPGSGLRKHLQQERKIMADEAEQSQKALKTVQGMLTHCSEESRVSIMDLRGGLLEKMSLPEALKTALTPLAEECGAVLEIIIDGEVRKLDKRVERNLLLVAREAATNAARHAMPKHLQVRLSYQPDSLRLEITDDGSGFNPKQAGEYGHFGLLGMQERVNTLKGRIKIESDRKSGTTIRVELPDPGKRKDKA